MNACKAIIHRDVKKFKEVKEFRADGPARPDKTFGFNF